MVLLDGCWLWLFIPLMVRSWETMNYLYVNEICSWSTVIFYGICGNPRKHWCSYSISTTWIFPRPANKSLWWMEMSWWPRGYRLPLHLVVGWKRKYVVRNRVSYSQADTWVILQCTSIVDLWPQLGGGLLKWDLAWKCQRMGGTWFRWCQLRIDKISDLSHAYLIYLDLIWFIYVCTWNVWLNVWFICGINFS